MLNAAIEVDVRIEQLEQYLVVDFLWGILAEVFVNLPDEVVLHANLF